MKINKIVYDFLDNLEDGFEIGGWALTEEINARSGKRTYPSTLLDYCRDYCDLTGGEWECIDRSRSIYKFHKGKIILNGFVPNGKE